MAKIICTPWKIDKQTGEAIRDFEPDSDLFAAMVTLDEEITGEPPEDPSLPWNWNASRHVDDDREDRRATDEEHEWIKQGYAATREEGQARADEVLKHEGYELT